MHPFFPFFIGFRRTRVLFVLIGAVGVGLRPGVASAQQVLGAKKSKVYHTHPDECGAVKNITESNRIYFPSAEAAQREGRRECKMCQKITERHKLESESVEPPSKSEQPETGSEETTRGRANAGDGRMRNEPPSGKPPSLSAPVARPLHERLCRVSSVGAGGTLLLEDGDKVCLAGVRCPHDGMAFSAEATRLLREAAAGRRVRLTWNGDEAPPRDRFGRMIVGVQVGSRGDDLGAKILEAGFGWLDASVPVDRRRSYERSQGDAAWAGLGVWRRLEGGAGRRPVVVGRYTTEYHPTDCPHTALLIEPTTITINEAKGRRLSPCELVGFVASESFRPVTSEGER